MRRFKFFAFFATIIFSAFCANIVVGDESLPIDSGADLSALKAEIASEKSSPKSAEESLSADFSQIQQNAKNPNGENNLTPDFSDDAVDAASVGADEDNTEDVPPAILPQSITPPPDAADQDDEENDEEDDDENDDGEEDPNFVAVASLSSDVEYLNFVAGCCTYKLNVPS